MPKTGRRSSDAQKTHYYGCHGAAESKENTIMRAGAMSGFYKAILVILVLTRPDSPCSSLIITVKTDCCIDLGDGRVFNWQTVAQCWDGLSNVDPTL